MEDKKKIKKEIRNGEVAILISEGWGAGWSTWNKHEDILLFHPKLVHMVESGNRAKITEEWMKINLGLENIYCGGAEDLCIYWLEIGTQYKIIEFDGNETLITSDDLETV